MPRVSMIMSVYNAKRFLSKAILSVINQSFSDFEFLIMDDGSKDNSLDIIKKYAKKDKRIKYFKQKNQGLAISLNILIEKSRGEYIARMDADDICFPKRLETQVDFLDNNYGYAMAVSGVVFISEDDSIISGKRIVGTSETISKILLKERNPITHGTVIIRKVILDAFKLPYRFKYGQDYDLWLRMLKKGCNIGVVNDVLYASRFGSELQMNFNKYVLRKKQSAILRKLYIDDLINDDNLVFSKINTLYKKFDVLQEAPFFFSNDVEKIYLKNFLINQNQKVLCGKVIRKIKKNGIRKLYLMYFLMSIIPKKIVYKILNFSLRKNNNDVENNILTEELLKIKIPEYRDINGVK